ncbi:MAG TPA: phosphatidate cytidylyltransferase [Hungateiclostridium thermocellum]|uniref:Phosphatidate cytidylyltransferase n=2 Tax=Acetivibrio thermocellus TaxID=1515 RepID=A3DE53_ACET2|nr:phosphatidate cytidylyltransferase [Acetivibrio thermocellus]ANV75969.1 phosphatidate cytidylyltransferase [Acetivibrio thermocellus DSM 2360]CDG35694.1 phosphatidate cytidylyltransferase [Acetivibrio thermocellus BC1]ABN52232.1 phosphatidate cytidylyltransferase [Acetivibrio thermocellus ATCC 27405]ADU74279.1 phosphatidate cytidylyltransferase [Acetivibrio thermocellus DSM 1313]ALX08221.1 phosphatidate cytidylyltransferase [Acetivibrio thermocellus AD2]
MLKTRVISALVGVILLIAVVCSGQMVLGTAVFFVSMLAMYEYFRSLTNAGYRPVKAVGYISCAAVLFLSWSEVLKNSFFQQIISLKSLLFAVFAMIVVLFSFIIFLHGKYNIVDISLTFFGVFYITFLLSFIVLTRNLKSGFLFVWLIFIGAFSTDTMAYFSGLFFGKHKLMPAISPKKTVEGAIGGVIGCALATFLYGLYLNKSGSIEFIPYFHFFVMGILCGIISQIGDWAASAIKRYVKVKDFGSIMPGHGGALDRFDSILFTAPVVYFYLSWII